jgi:serine O-acetyltransferase
MNYFVGHTLGVCLLQLQDQLKRELRMRETRDHEGSSAGGMEARSLAMVVAFAKRLPDLRETVDRDLVAAFRGDPVATCLEEILVCYPAVRAIIYYRVAHELYILGAPVIARIITELSHSDTGVDIHPGAKIGDHFFIDHGKGVVIDGTTIIGNHVRLYQAVTLGAKHDLLNDKGDPVNGQSQHPIVEDHVIIYPGATILGRVTIGRGSTIGGNVWLTRSVPPGSVITQAQDRQEKFVDGAGI